MSVGTLGRAPSKQSLRVYRNGYEYDWWRLMAAGPRSTTVGGGAQESVV